jgi:hypothetical protein
MIEIVSAKSLPKREFFRFESEIFEIFSRKSSILGAWRPVANREDAGHRREVADIAVHLAKEAGGISYVRYVTRGEIDYFASNRGIDPQGIRSAE